MTRLDASYVLTVPGAALALAAAEVFGFGFPEVAIGVGRSEVACRQLVVRGATLHRAGRRRLEADRREREEVAARFFDALRDGDVDGLSGLLAAVVQMVGMGGKAPALPRSVIGADNVARVLAPIFRRSPRSTR
jgi:RNA polymerase sigma-70 factor (ECF subfamily)